MFVCMYIHVRVIWTLYSWAEDTHVLIKDFVKAPPFMDFTTHIQVSCIVFFTVAGNYSTRQCKRENECGLWGCSSVYWWMEVHSWSETANESGRGGWGWTQGTATGTLLLLLSEGLRKNSVTTRRGYRQWAPLTEQLSSGSGFNHHFGGVTCIVCELHTHTYSTKRKGLN